MLSFYIKGAVYRAADLTTGFKVKRFLIKDVNMFPIDVSIGPFSVINCEIFLGKHYVILAACTRCKCLTPWEQSQSASFKDLDLLASTVSASTLCS